MGRRIVHCSVGFLKGQKMSWFWNLKLEFISCECFSEISP